MATISDFLNQVIGERSVGRTSLLTDIDMFKGVILELSQQAGANLLFQDEGVDVVSSDTANFTGTGVTVTDVGGVATINVDSGMTSLEVQDEGTAILSTQTVNFIGDDVVVTDNAGVADVTISPTPTSVDFELDGVAVLSGNTINFDNSQTPANSMTAISVIDVAGVATIQAATLMTLNETGVVFPFIGSTLRFTGPDVSLIQNGLEVEVDITPTPTVVSFEDEGVNIVDGDTVNFTGAGVTVTDVAGVATVDIPGGGGGPFRGALISKSADQIIGGGSTNAVTYDVVEYDTDGFFSAPGAFTIQAGMSRVRLTSNMANLSTTGQLVLGMQKNGVTVIGGFQCDTDTAGTDNLNGVSAVLSVSPGDVFRATAFSTNATAIAASDQTWFAIEVVE